MQNLNGTNIAEIKIYFYPENYHDAYLINIEDHLNFECVN